MGLLTENTDYYVRPDANLGMKMVLVQTINTVDAADTIEIDLTKYGIAATGLIGVLGFKHTTDNSIMEQEQPTTAVSGNTLTLTVPGGTNDDPRFYIIFGFAEPNP